jgi:hypothetical protein
VIYALGESDKAYAIYVGPKNPREAAKQKPQARTLTISLELPAGTYRSEWINPLTGKTEKRETHRHKGGKLSLHSPAFSEDVAITLKRR